MRGKGYDVVSRLCRVRITPACAGKRDKTGWTTTCPRDHPRMCGEKPKVMNLVLVRPGSPPHVRGKELRTAFKPCRLGITPACAGKSVTYRCYISEGKDHPRMCGEKIHPEECLQELIGSPPHVRGKGPDARLDRSEYRITPACAGKSSVRQRVLLSLWDHPRMCGEKTGFGKSAFTKSGSPPHVRGKGERKTGKTRRVGITPACAGKRFLLLRP